MPQLLTPCSSSRIVPLGLQLVRVRARARARARARVGTRPRARARGGGGPSLHLLQRRLRLLEGADAERVDDCVVLRALERHRRRVHDRERHVGQAGRPALRSTQLRDLAGADLEHVLREVGDEQLADCLGVEGEVAARATGDLQHPALGVRSDLSPQLEDARGGLVALDLGIIAGRQRVEGAAALAGTRQWRLRR